jgi:hypothetical protein
MSSQSFNAANSKGFQNPKALSTLSKGLDTMSQKSKQPVKTRVVENNFRGRPIDKLTAEHSSPQVKPLSSIYGDDFKQATKTVQSTPKAIQSPPGPKSARDTQAAPTQNNPDNIHIVNLPGPNGNIEQAQTQPDNKS